MNSALPHNVRSFIIRFLILFGCALVPLALFAALDSSDPMDLKGLAQRTANEYDRLIQLRERQVFSFAAFPSIRAFTSTAPETRSERAAVASNELQAWISADPNIRQVFITDAAGIIIMSTDQAWHSDVSARGFVRDALHGELAVSPIARDVGENSTYYAAPVLNNSREIAGALVIRVVAQEMWSVASHGENFYTILCDENGVRLDDAGDPARRLASLGPLDATHATNIVKEQTYGAELLQPRATNLSRAQDIIAQGALDQLSARDLDADAFAAQRLASKPWYVLALAPQSIFEGIFSRLVIPMGVALVFALGGAFLVGRL